jgi:hypothetical protein
MSAGIPIAQPKVLSFLKICQKLCFRLSCAVVRQVLTPHPTESYEQTRYASLLAQHTLRQTLGKRDRRHQV